MGEPAWDRPIYWSALLCGSALALAMCTYGAIRATIDLSTPDGFQYRCGTATTDRMLNGVRVLDYGDIVASFPEGGAQFTQGGNRIPRREAIDRLHCHVPRYY